jgi:hypothetical protein
LSWSWSLHSLSGIYSLRAVSIRYHISMHVVVAKCNLFLFIHRSRSRLTLFLLHVPCTSFSLF